MYFLTDENARAGKKLGARLTNGVKETQSNRVDESKVVVTNHEADAAPKEIVEISSGEESSEYESDEDDVEAAKQLTNGLEGDAEAGADDVAMDDADNDDDDDDENQEMDKDDTAPSFGDLLHASHPDAIDVQAAFANRNAQDHALVPINGDRVLTAPSATSLGTVLTQALRTNDKDLLESCFQTRDTQSIRSTIQRLQSPLVADLLQRLAERLYKRPGRAGNLMVWVQWSLVAHGGYLASQPQVLKKLKALSQVVKERASGLQSLMTLKGKLDMLGAQLELRQAIQDTRAGVFDDDDDEEDPNVIYIEGEDDEDSDDMDNQPAITSRKQNKTAAKSRSLGNASDDDDMDDLHLTNGVADSADESEDIEDDNVEGLIDDEAEVTSDEEGEDSDDDVDEDEDISDDDDDESASEDEAPPARAPKPQRLSDRRR